MKTIFHTDSYPASCIRTPGRTRIMVLYTVGVLFSLLCLLATPAAFARDTDFDHFTTGFPLSGAHARVECEDCHQRGVFQGTPSQCNACHNGRTAVGKDSQHIQSLDTCDDCHTAFSWATRAVDHSSVIGECTSCHQLPVKHLATGSTCDNCHNTLSWNATGFDHSDITQPCASCHNGTDATGKSNNHIPTNAACDDCHTPRSWQNARVDHTSLTAACVSCHNGIVAEGKPRNHPTPSSDVCDDCHNTRTWLGAGFNHADVVPGTCSNCHEKNAGHITSSNICDDCHVGTTTWNNAKFEHTPGAQCDTCHNGNPTVGKPNDHIASTNNCEACHRNFISFGNVSMNSAAHNDVLGTCASCHQKDLPNNHWPVTQGCEECHRTSSWGTVTNYSHNNSDYPGGPHNGITCTRCHRMDGSNFEPATPNGHTGDERCSDCHAGKFDAQEDKHRPVGPGGGKLLADNLDCGNSSCHGTGAGGW